MEAYDQYPNWVKNKKMVMIRTKSMVWCSNRKQKHSVHEIINQKRKELKKKKLRNDVRHYLNHTIINMKKTEEGERKKHEHKREAEKLKYIQNHLDGFEFSLI